MHRKCISLSIPHQIIDFGRGIPRLSLNEDSPAERWVRLIRPGDSPRNNPFSALLASWLKDFLKAQKKI